MNSNKPDKFQAVVLALMALFENDSRFKFVVYRDDSVDIIARNEKLVIYDSPALTKEVGNIIQKNRPITLQSNGLSFYNLNGMLLIPIRWKGRTGYIRHNDINPLDGEKHTVLHDCTLYEAKDLKIKTGGVKKGAEVMAFGTSNKAAIEVMLPDGKRGYIRSTHIEI